MPFFPGGPRAPGDPCEQAQHASLGKLPINGRMYLSERDFRTLFPTKAICFQISPDCALNYFEKKNWHSELARKK